MAVKKIEALNKHENPSTNTNQFDIEKYLNENWDHIKDVVDNNAEELINTQANIETSQTEIIQKLKENQIHITTDQSSNINVQDCSDLEGRIEVEGNSVQEGEPTPETPVEIQNVEGSIPITVCNKNVFDKNNTNIINGYFTTSNIISEPNNRTIWIKCKPNTIYTVQKKAGQRFAVGFTEEEPIIGSSVQTPKTDNYGNKITNTSLENSKYIIVYVANYNIGTEILWQDILDSLQIEENSIATEYIEHQQQTITFPLQEGQKLMKGDYLADDGIHHKRKQVELVGTEYWNLSGKTYYIGFSDKKMRYTLIKGAMLCNKFKESVSSQTVNIELNEFYEGYYQTGNKNVFFNYDDGVGGVANWKSYLAEQKANGTPVIVEYELAEEEIEPYTPEQQEAYNKLQKVLPYKLVTNIFTDLALLKFNYIADTKTYIDNKFNNLAQQFLNL